MSNPETYMPINEELKEPLVVECPHCNEPILLDKLNCCIFRHGTIIESGVQINPHSSKEICDNHANNKDIYGCGKPFKIIKIKNTDEFKAEKCEYI